MRGRVFDCKKHTNIKRHACYRRIKGGRYYKSVAKYKSEKRRRQQTLLLHNHGYSVKQVAALLGVSRRTVQRDLQKLQPCTEVKLNRRGWEGLSSELSLSNRELIKFIKGYREIIHKVRIRAKVKELTVKVNVDKVFAGNLDDAVRFVPRLPVVLGDWGKVTFELHAQHRVIEAAHLYFGITPQNRLIIETNLTVIPLENPNFLGLHVWDPANPMQHSDQASLGQLAQIQHRMFNFQDPWSIEEFRNLTAKQQDRLLEQYSELCGQRKNEHKAKKLTITLNVELAVNAAYPASFNPHLPLALCDYGKIFLKLQAANKTQHLITLQATDIKDSLVNIEKSQPHSRRKLNILEGLQIIEKTNTLTQQTDKALL